MNNATVALLLGALTLIASPGCGGDEFDAKVSGTVTLDGKAVGPGTVVFVPADGSNPATGTIQVDGSYFLRSNRAEGLLPGHYQASVMVFDQPPIPAGERSTVQPKLLTPQKYSEASTSGLEFDVAPGENAIDLKLTST